MIFNLSYKILLFHIKVFEIVCLTQSLNDFDFLQITTRNNQFHWSINQFLIILLAHIFHYDISVFFFSLFFVDELIIIDVKMSTQEDDGIIDKEEETKPLINSSINNSYDTQDEDLESLKKKKEEGGKEEEEEEEEEPLLKLRQRILYSSLQAGISFLFGATGSWLAYFYAPPGDGKLVSPVVYSLSILLGRFLNGILEPLIGYVSDRTRTRFGRRTPYILIASPLMAITFSMLWFMPFEPMSVGASLWFFVLFSLNNFFGACVLAPYMALLPEVTRGRKERIQVSSFMAIWGILGNLAVSFIGPIDNVLEDGIEIFGYVLTGIQFYCSLYSILMIIFCWLAALSIHEKPILDVQYSSLTIPQEFKIAFSNFSFVTFLSFQSLTVAAITMWQAVFPYVCTVVLETEGGLVDIGKGETWVGVFALILLVGALASVPFISIFARKFGKKVVILVAGSIGAITVGLTFLIQYLKDPGIGLLVIMVLSAIPLGILFVLPNAVFADVLVWDEKQTGKKREGIYTGVRLFTVRLTSGIGSFLVVPLISLGDTPENPIGIMIMFPIAACLLTIGTLIFIKYPFKM